MLRITTQAEKTGTERLRLGRRLAGEYVAELQIAAAAALGRSPRLVLDLAGLTFIDAEAVKLLRVLQEQEFEPVGPHDTGGRAGAVRPGSSACTRTRHRAIALRHRLTLPRYFVAPTKNKGRS